MFFSLQGTGMQSLVSPSLAGRFFTIAPPGKPEHMNICYFTKKFTKKESSLTLFSAPPSFFSHSIIILPSNLAATPTFRDYQGQWPLLDPSSSLDAVAKLSWPALLSQMTDWCSTFFSHFSGFIATIDSSWDSFCLHLCLSRFCFLALNSKNTSSRKPSLFPPILHSLCSFGTWGVALE